MSRRCRASLFEDLGAGGVDGSNDFDSGCDCARISAPKPPCVEPIVYGSNILLDPDFEQFVALVGDDIGPDGETFPGEHSFETTQPKGLYWAQQFGQEFYGDTPWAVFSNFGSVADNDILQENRAHLSTADPHQGLIHVRYVVPTTTEVSAGGASFYTFNVEMQPIGFRMCSSLSKWYGTTPPSDPQMRGVWTNRVAPGDFVLVSCYVKASTVSDNPRVFLSAPMWSADLSTFITTGSSFPSWFTDEAMTTTYAEHVFACFAPAGVGYMGCELSMYVDGGGSIHTEMDMDNVRVTQIQAGQGILLCAFNSLVTIDNSTTETSFL